MYNLTHYENYKHFADRNADPRVTLVHRLDETRPQGASVRSLAALIAKLRGNR